MQNIVRFLIDMQATADGAMAVAKRIHGQLTSVENKANGVRAALRKAFSAEGFKSALMSVPAMQFLLNPYTVIGAGIGAITKLGAEAEMTATAFTTLVGEEGKAKSILKDIGDFANSTPFDKLNLIDSTKTMMTFGVASEKAMTYMRQLGDISGGNAEKLQSLSLAMGQVSSSTILNGQDLNQFINAGFNPLQELSKMTGKTYRELKEYMSDGRITAENVAQAIAHATAEGGQYYGQLAAGAETIQGRWSTAIGKIREVAEGLFKHLKPLLFDLFDFFEAALPPIVKGLTFVFKVIAGGIGWIVEWRDELALAASLFGILIGTAKAYTLATLAYTAVVKGVILASKAWTVVQYALNLAMSLNTVGAVIAAIAALVAVGVYCWHKFAGFRAFLLTMWDTLKGFGTIIKDFVIARIKELLGAVGDVAKAFQLLFSGDFAGAGNAIGSAAKKFAGVESYTNAFQSAKGLVSGVTDNYKAHHKTETAKQAEREKEESKNKISTPSLAGSNIGEVVFGAAKGKGGKAGKGKGKGGKDSATANAIATGGQRNTSINMTIGKFFDQINVQMMDKADTSELQRIILETLNRSLAIATAADR